MTMIDTRATATVMVPNIVQLVNEGDTTFNMRYGPTQRLIIEPGDSIMVNEEVAWHYLGRWWTVDTERDKARRDEWQRLRTLYGAYEDEAIWETNRPRLKCYDPSGKTLITVIDDPEGIKGGTQTQLGREMTLESQIAILKDNQLRLEAQLANLNAQSVNEGQPTPASDTPPRPAQPIAGPPNLRTVAEGVQVPVAPPAVTPPDPDEGAFGARLPVQETVVHDPTETEVEEDAPAVIPHGPSVTEGRTGGRAPKKS